MSDEERAYQEFFAKAIQKAQELEDDYSKLSQRNQQRFWQDLAKSAEAKARLEFLRNFLNQM